MMHSSIVNCPNVHYEQCQNRLKGKWEEKIVVKHAPRSMFLEGRSTAKVGIHPRHVMLHHCHPHEPHISDH